ncbi:MAG: DUF5652 family protein [Nanoarchaeota archaeon]|nr:DUF5652 family protein [Nanoarchaeota archaeon]
MKKEYIIFIFVMLLIPIIYAATIEDETTYNIDTGRASSLSSYNIPAGALSQEQLQYLLENNPQFREKFEKLVKFFIILGILIIIDMILKGFAMWRAAKKESKVWFWVLLVVSSLGILPLIYLLVTKPVSKKKKK